MGRLIPRIVFLCCIESVLESVLFCARQIAVEGGARWTKRIVLSGILPLMLGLVYFSLIVLFFGQTEGALLKGYTALSIAALKDHLELVKYFTVSV